MSTSLNIEAISRVSSALELADNQFRENARLAAVEEEKGLQQKEAHLLVGVQTLLSSADLERLVHRVGHLTLACAPCASRGGSDELELQKDKIGPMMLGFPGFTKPKIRLTDLNSERGRQFIRDVLIKRFNLTAETLITRVNGAVAALEKGA